MSPYRIIPFVSLTCAFAVLSCGGEPAEDDARDLTLAPAESVITIADVPEERPAGQSTTPPARPASQPTQPPARSPEAAPRQPAPRVSRPTLSEGTVVMLYAADTLTSRHNQVGQPVAALTAQPMVGSDNREVIPAGAIFTGTITELAPAGTPGGEGRMVLVFDHVSFGGQSYPIEARVDSLGSHMKGRGVTANEAAKVGAGAVVGAIAGGIIGGDRKGAAIGAAAGAVAGVGIAAATRDIDIILDAGAPIRIVLTAPFVLATS